MSHYIVDRRPNGKGKSTPNRKKLLDRVKGSVKKTVKEAVQNGNIADIVKGGNKVRVPVKDMKEPSISHGEGGVTERTIPGNDRHKFNTGDTIARPKKGGGGQGQGKAGNGGDGEDDFVFELTRDEFLEFFFEDLELPDLAKKKLAVTDEKKPQRNGFASEGNPSALDLMQTMKSSISRRAALRTPKKKKLRVLEAALIVSKEELEAYYAADPADVEPGLGGLMAAAIEAQEAEIEALKKKIKHVPYVDDIDLRYRNWVQKPEPATNAVMFCLMDVSGSMGTWEKDIAKRFYMLLYLFLYKNYEKVELVFVRHHHTADEVDEHTFFYDRASGGTVVSEGLKLVNKIIDDRYDSAKWNVYVAQASDGDNWQSDHEATITELNKILSKVQFYFYIDINKYGSSEMFTLYQEQVTAKNFTQERIADVAEIYGVFRKMFEAR